MTWQQLITVFFCADEPGSTGDEGAVTTYLADGATTTVTTAAVDFDSHYARVAKRACHSEKHSSALAPDATQQDASAQPTATESGTKSAAKSTATQRLQRLKNKGGKKKGLQPVRLGKGGRGSKPAKKGGSKKRR